MEFAYFCPNCLKSHIYTIDLTQSIPMDGTVWVKAIAQGCPVHCHFVYKVVLTAEYKKMCKEAGVLPQEEVK